MADPLRQGFAIDKPIVIDRMDRAIVELREQNLNECAYTFWLNYEDHMKVLGCLGGDLVCPLPESDGRRRYNGVMISQSPHVPLGQVVVLPEGVHPRVRF